jgi:hypothetical protein
VVHALEAHIATLKTELASEKERADRATAELRGEVELLKGQLTGERAARQDQTARGGPCGQGDGRAGRACAPEIIAFEGSIILPAVW